MMTITWLVEVRTLALPTIVSSGWFEPARLQIGTKLPIRKVWNARTVAGSDARSTMCSTTGADCKFDCTFIGALDETIQLLVH